jgi:hypothetical protein
MEEVMGQKLLTASRKPPTKPQRKAKVKYVVSVANAQMGKLADGRHFTAALMGDALHKANQSIPNQKERRHQNLFKFFAAAKQDPFGRDFVSFLFVYKIHSLTSNKYLLFILSLVINVNFSFHLLNMIFLSSFCALSPQGREVTPFRKGKDRDVARIFFIKYDPYWFFTAIG